MSDDRGRVAPHHSNFPVAPKPAVPSLPSSSGAFLGSRTRIARKDKEFVEASTALIESQIKQGRAFTSLIEARSEAALALARLQSLPEVAAHAYYKGRAERAAQEEQWLHDAHIASLEHEREAIHAQVEVDRAKQRLAELQPASTEPPAPTPAASKGISIAEVQVCAQRLPEMNRETVETLCMMLSGLLAEKNS